MVRGHAPRDRLAEDRVSGTDDGTDHEVPGAVVTGDPSYPSLRAARGSAERFELGRQRALVEPHETLLVGPYLVEVDVIEAGVAVRLDLLRCVSGSGPQAMASVMSSADTIAAACSK